MRYRDKWPEYARQWDAMVVTRPEEIQHVGEYAMKHKAQYKAVEAKTGVPWPLLAALHYREGSGDFDTYFGNGDPLDRPTRHVPYHRGPFDTWEEGAIDALSIDGLDAVSDWRLEKALFYAEKFNGVGYNNRGRASPYVWAGTNQQQRGKYVGDGLWDGGAWDSQPGVAPMMAKIMELDGYTLQRES